MKKSYYTFIISTIVFMILALTSFSRESFGTFKDWSYSQSEVFGLVKLTKPFGRTYCNISALDDHSTRVQEINPMGVVTNTTVVTFSNGKLSMITEADQWGDINKILKFTSSGNDEFTVTETNKGVNNLLPCKAMMYIFKNNLLAEVKYLSFSNQLSNNKNGVAIERYERYEDENRFSLIKELSFYDEQGEPVNDKERYCHKVVSERDERGNKLSVAYFDTENLPKRNANAVYKIKYSYDKNDNKTEDTYIGLNGEISLNIYDVARLYYEYKNGMETKVTFYDKKNDIVKANNAGSGIAITKQEYDKSGNLVAKFYFDEHKNPMNDHYGKHQVNYKYNPSNMLVQEEYFDKNKKPVTDNSNVHKYTYVRDSIGRKVQSGFYDENNLPARNKRDDVYMIKYKYDSLGLKLSVSYWKDENTKMWRWDGYHEMIYKYNEQGQEIENTDYDKNGNLFAGECGYSRTLIKYDPNTQIGEFSRFNGDTPVAIIAGFAEKYHSIKYIYDNKNNLSKIEYFDISGNPTNAKINLGDGFYCHKIELVYTGNRITEEKCYVANNDFPVKVIDCLKSDYIAISGINKGYKNK